MTFSEYSDWMFGAVIVCVIVALIITRVMAKVAITKPKLQKGALIFAIVVLVVLGVWGVLYEVFR